MSATEAKPQPATADAKRIMELLPHRPPMLLIDRMIDIVPNESATGVRAISISDPIFLGHFPGHPIMPGVMIVEAMAQTAGALIMYSMNTTSDDKLVYFIAHVATKKVASWRSTASAAGSRDLKTLLEAPCVFVIGP